MTDAKTQISFKQWMMNNYPDEGGCCFGNNDEKYFDCVECPFRVEYEQILYSEKAKLAELKGQKK